MMAKSIVARTHNLSKVGFIWVAIWTAMPEPEVQHEAKDAVSLMSERTLVHIAVTFGAANPHHSWHRPHIHLPHVHLPHLHLPHFTTASSHADQAAASHKSTFLRGAGKSVKHLFGGSSGAGGVKASDGRSTQLFSADGDHTAPAAKASAPPSKEPTAEELVARMKKKDLERLVLKKHKEGKISWGDLGGRPPAAQQMGAAAGAAGTSPSKTLIGQHRLPNHLASRLSPDDRVHLLEDFQTFDPKQTGRVTLDNYVKVKLKQHERDSDPLEEVEIIAAFQAMDEDSDGSISFTEFASEWIHDHLDHQARRAH